MNRPVCYTIGHSDHDYNKFFSLLEMFSIRYLVDVRSAPYSRHAVQFNKAALAAETERRGLEYLYEGQDLGGKYSDPGLLLPDGKVDYRRVSLLDQFQAGIRRVAELCLRAETVLVCAEKDPLSCHRFILDGRALLRQGLEVRHILADGTCLVHSFWERKSVSAWEAKHSQYSLFEAYGSAGPVLDYVYAALASGRRPLKKG